MIKPGAQRSRLQRGKLELLAVQERKRSVAAKGGRITPSTWSVRWLLVTLTVLRVDVAPATGKMHFSGKGSGGCALVIDVI